MPEIKQRSRCHRIGNAICTMSSVERRPFPSKHHQLHNGAWSLVDEAQAERALYAPWVGSGNVPVARTRQHLWPAIPSSAAQAAFIGLRPRPNQLGANFAHDILRRRHPLDRSAASSGPCHGRCMILVQPMPSARLWH